MSFFGQVRDALNKSIDEYEQNGGSRDEFAALNNFLEGGEESEESKEIPYENGVSIVHSTALKHNDKSNNKYTVKNTTDSLRSGEDIEYSIRHDSPYSSPENVIWHGGIGGTRYLGSGIGDVMNPEYFSNANISEKYSPLSVNVDNNNTRVGSMNVYYDDDGAIAAIDLQTDFILPNGKSYKKQRIQGSKNISDFFKSMELNLNSYSANNTRNNTGVNFGGQNERWAPTNIFGSRGVLSGSGPLRLNKSELDRFYGAGHGNADWDNYWHGQSVLMEGE